jgi:uncharacterized protein YggE
MNVGIWVTGRGEIAATPDLAVLELGVQALGDRVQDARRDAAKAMDRMVAVLKARGVADRDIHTRSFNIYPRYTSREVYKCPEVPKTAPAPPGDIRRSETTGKCYQYHEQVIEGYQMTNLVTVNVRDLNAIGSIIDEITEVGGDLTRVHNIRFTIESTRALYDRARAAAVEDLMAKARQVAALTGVQLGKLVYITESGGDVSKIQPYARATAEAGASPATPILPGELEVVITVQAVFAIG